MKTKTTKAASFFEKQKKSNKYFIYDPGTDIFFQCLKRPFGYVSVRNKNNGDELGYTLKYYPQDEKDFLLMVEFFYFYNIFNLHESGKEMFHYETFSDRYRMLEVDLGTN